MFRTCTGKPNQFIIILQKSSNLKIASLFWFNNLLLVFYYIQIYIQFINY